MNIKHSIFFYSFLLDRLLQQEKIADSSEESDATNSTDTEEGSHRESNPAKKFVSILIFHFISRLSKVRS